MSDKKKSVINLHSFLWFISLVGRSMLFLPLTCLLCFFFLPTLGGYALSVSVLVHVSFVATALFRELMHKRFTKLPPFKQNTICLLAMLIFAAVCGAAGLLHSVIFSVGTWLLCLVASILGYMFAFDHYSLASSSKCFLATLIINFIAAITGYLIKGERLYDPFITWLTVGLFIFVIIYAVCSNQSNIDNMMERRGHSMASLPKKVRQYNLILVLVLLGMVFAGFIFREQLIILLGYIFNGIIYAINLIMYVIDWLIKLMYGGDSTIGQQQMGDPSDMFGEKTTNNTFDWGTPLFIIAAIVVIIWKRREIWRFIKGIFNSIIGIISDFLKRTVPELANRQETELGYYDEVEKLEGEEAVKSAHKQTKLQAIRRWKKEYRAFQKNGGESRLSTGYSLLYRGLKLTDIPPSVCETPYEILNHTRELITSGAYPKAIEGYVLERYAEKTATKQDCEEMDASLSFLNRLL